jgi:5'(3')-deoxyribonucleotidase
MIPFLDLDGVIVDFAQGCIDWYNLDCTPEDFTEWGAIFDFFTGKEIDFWEGLTDKFWIGLGFTKEAKRILTLVGPMKPCILTSPSHIGGSGGKQQWIKENLPDYYNEERYLIGPAKNYMAHKNSLLIDDAEENVDKFRKGVNGNGGHAILVPRPWNRLRGNDVLKHIKTELDKIKEMIG